VRDICSSDTGKDFLIGVMIADIATDHDADHHVVH
jgi:hypothetical protein